MFAVALTLQSGIGLTAFESGNAFIALGAAYFIGAMRSTRMVERFGKRTTLLTGCGIQMVGLIALIGTFQFAWPDVGVFTLMPATILIGFGQSFIVSTFYRIGMSGVPHHQAGAGSAVLSTVQQSALGLGPMLLGGVFTQINVHGNHLAAISGTLGVELLMMVTLVILTSLNRRTFQPVTAEG